jgi:hypothetical protein
MMRLAAIGRRSGRTRLAIVGYFWARRQVAHGLSPVIFGAAMRRHQL